jgi:hypothetical protein
LEVCFNGVPAVLIPLTGLFVEWKLSLLRGLPSLLLAFLPGCFGDNGGFSSSPPPISKEAILLGAVTNPKSPLLKLGSGGRTGELDEILRRVGSELFGSSENGAEGGKRNSLDMGTVFGRD